VLRFQVQVDAGVCCKDFIAEAGVDARERVAECLRRITWTH